MSLADAARAIGSAFDAVLFDLDATLLNTEDALDTAIVDALRLGWGVEADVETIAAFRGAPDLGPGSWAEAMSARHAPALHNATPEDLCARAYALFDARAHEVDAMPGAPALVAALAAAGVPMAIATSSTRASWELKRSHHAHLFAHMRAVVTVEDVAPRAKPAPDCYVEAARRLGVRIDRCLVVEDSLPGVTAGVAAGATVVAVPAARSRAAVARAGAHLVLASLTELTYAPEPRAAAPAAGAATRAGAGGPAATTA